MPDEIRVNRPSGQASQAAPVYSGAAAVVQPQPKRPSKLPWIILAVVVVVLAVLGFLFRDKLFGGHAGGSSVVSSPKLSGYQAVFLTNGQVYFGKITSQDSGTLTLTDIYYLQVLQPPLQGQQQPGQAAAQQQPQISLVKLGNELHGPADVMHIYKNQVLFYEDLKADGKVAQAIEQYKANPQNNPATQSAPAVQPAK